MALSDYKTKNRSELREEESRLRRELFDLQFKHGTRQLSDTASISRTRRQIAQVMTLSSEKAAAENA